MDYDNFVIETYREIIREMDKGVPGGIQKFSGYVVRGVDPKIQKALRDMITFFSYGGTMWQGNDLYFYFEH